MTYTFRTSGPWGVGTSTDLTPAQVDNNFWQAIQDIEAKAEQGVGISNFVVSGNLMTVVLTDHTLLGPYPLPIATLNFRGEWHPSTAYLTNDIITHGGSTYLVLANHTSALTFDPGANNGLGQDYYGLLLQNPTITVPTGGAVGTFLRKAGTADFATAWEHALLEDLADVDLTTSPTPPNGDVLTWLGGQWTNATPAKALDNLSDVTITAPATGQLLVYNSGISQWVNEPAAVGSGINIQETSPLQRGEPLVYNGTLFTNTPTVDLPFGANYVATGATTIDRSTGEVQEIQLSGNVTLTFTGWPVSNPTDRHFARLVLAIVNPSTHLVTWPTVKWAGGIIPIVSANATDIFIFFSLDGGTTVYGNVVGQNYF